MRRRRDPLRLDPDAHRGGGGGGGEVPILMESSGEAFSLGKAASEAGYRFETHSEVSSTFDLALARAREGEASRLWIVARSQTNGRGRHGRVFLSPPGNLYASLLLLEGCRRADAPELGFVAGLALFDAASVVTGLEHPRLSLKWPNDLLVDGKKCAGLLARRPSASRRRLCPDPWHRRQRRRPSARPAGSDHARPLCARGDGRAAFSALI